MDIKKDLIQPIGKHNPPTECVRTECVKHLVEYPFEHFNPMQSLFIPYVDQEEKNVVVTSGTGSGKCIRSDSLVLTEGGMIEIGSLFDRSKSVDNCHELRLRVSTPIAEGGIDTASRIYHDGESESFEVCTSFGYEVCGTGKHRIRVVSLDGDVVWKTLDEVHIGDVAILSKGQWMFGNDHSMTLDQAFFSGFSICRERSDAPEDHGIPQSILRAGKERVVAFIRGMYKGCGNLWRTSTDNRLSVEFELLPYKLAKQLQVVLLNFGIVSDLCKPHSPQGTCSLHIRERSIEDYVSYIGFDSRFLEEHASRAYCENTVSYVSGCHIPYLTELFSELASAVESFFASKCVDDVLGYMGRTDERCNIYYTFLNTEHKSVDRHDARNVVNWLAGLGMPKKTEPLIEKLRYICSDEFFFDTIQEKRRCVSDNYDFVVPDTHSFVANGFINHNTVIAELSIGQTVFGSGRTKKACYLAPMKSLTEQNLDEWKNCPHSFNQLSIAVLTGDYEMNAQKEKELLDADIVLCTSEMLDSKSRNFAGNKWLHDIGLIVVDESHLIGCKGRGPRLETALMRYIRHNPNCRVVLMSATLPNDRDLVRWMNRLTGRETILIESNYRPCILNKHILTFDDSIRRKYADQELARMDVILAQIRRNPNEQHLVFTGNKSWGRSFLNKLLDSGFEAQFHNADLSLDKRKKIERDFNDGKFSVLVASSTLAWGVNINARFVYLAHTSYGKTEMEVSDVDQACGRAGRVKYHTVGDAFIIVPDSKKEEEKARIEGGFMVKSQLNDVRQLLFHVVGEIHGGRILTKDDLYKWYEMSLAAIQENHLTEDTCEKVLYYLSRISMIKFDEEKQIWRTTQLGAIASHMYQDPLVVSDWYKNFKDLRKIVALDNDPNADSIDFQVSWALANTYDNREEGFLSMADKELSQITEFGSRLGNMKNPAIKAASIYYNMLKGRQIDDALLSTYNGIVMDVDRVITTLKLIHTKYGKAIADSVPSVSGYRYNSTGWDILKYRLKYGVPTKYVGLVCLPEVGKAYAERLYMRGIRSKHDILNNRSIVESIIGAKRTERLFNFLKEGKK